ncbi:hypothetical protein HMPREF1218_1936 [Hoylesella pleuritidis F0068]|uniref:Uncharacterized protein n=1 Tax=Hoylesella pleuritidis F0068 TaxID=1081904 RepID=U2MW94_9BACT|nr:hypothetical protein HMPREF1218_1936 [Hoylesella pleuritidis F0068]
MWRRVAYLKATFTDSFGFTDRLTRLFFEGLFLLFRSYKKKAAVTKGKAREGQGLFDT